MRQGGWGGIALSASHGVITADHDKPGVRRNVLASRTPRHPQPADTANCDGRSRVDGSPLWVFESVTGSLGTQDLNFVFAAAAVDPVDEDAVVLVEPGDPDALVVFPPILDAIAQDRPGPAAARWLGNIWESSLNHV
jgi:hypothetical protein